MQNNKTIRMYHVTALSNLARAYDKYSRVYDKSRLPHSSFPGQFFVLHAHELHIGVRKARNLVARLGLPGDGLLVLAMQVAADALQPNVRTGLGQFIVGDAITLDAVYGLNDAENISDDAVVLPLEWAIEEAMARSLVCLNPVLQAYAALRPRSLSILPIARACQAACRFCFSEASVSSEVPASAACLSQWLTACERAKAAGASRFVITGGGEPGLLPHAQMLGLIRVGRAHFDKGVLITNGVHLARLSESDRRARLLDCAQAGLTTLAISRHHHEAAINQAIMGLDTRTERVLASWRALSAEPSEPGANRLGVRLICVLQRGGVASRSALAHYLTWVAQAGVRELCFKELYVSTTLESRYHAAPENAWSHANQVPLSLLLDALADWGFVRDSELPWGAPVLTGHWHGVRLRIAAYTEPSVLWERTHGLARSWNLMADGHCLASLEDPDSGVALGEAPEVNAVPARPQPLSATLRPATRIAPIAWVQRENAPCS